MSDPTLLEQKMAGCSEETGDIFDSQRNYSCLKMRMLKFQVQFRAVHQLQPAQKPYQERTAPDALQHCPESNQSQDHQLRVQPHCPIRVPKEHCSHTQWTLYSPPLLLKRLCSDLDLLCLGFSVLFYFSAKFMLNIYRIFPEHFSEHLCKHFIVTVHRFFFFSIVPVFSLKKKERCNVIMSHNRLCHVTQVSQSC